MADTSYLTIHQMWQTPFVRGVYSLLPTMDMVMQRFYGAIDASKRTYTPSRTFGWDIFNKTRTVATMKTPMTAPSTIHRQKIGHQTGTLIRVAEKMHFFEEEYMNLRPMGAPIGTLNESGERWMSEQIDFATQRHRNLMEISLARMLQGGFGLGVSGEMMYLTELNAANNIVNIDMGTPATHTGTLNGLIDETWDNPHADIVKQLSALRQRAIAESGYDLSVAWTDSITISYLMQNSTLADIRGSVNRAWQSWDWNNKAVNVEPGDRTLGAGVDVVFSAIPWLTFKVNDAVVSLGTSSDPQGTDSFTITDLTRVVPAGKVLFTPPPQGDWWTVYEGAEPVRTTYGGASRVIKGFGTYEYLIPDNPPAREAGLIDNFLPVLRFPRAVWNATVRDATGDHS